MTSKAVKQGARCIDCESVLRHNPVVRKLIAAVRAAIETGGWAMSVPPAEAYAVYVALAAFQDEVTP